MEPNSDMDVTVMHEVEKAPYQHATHHEKPLYDSDDIHQAALADNPETAEKPNLTTILSIMFIGMSTVAPLGCGFIVATSILTDIGTDLGNTTSLGWVVSGWSIASSVSFSLAGSLSDIFGRRHVLLAGQSVSLVGSIVAATAHNLGALIGGSTLLGFSCGFVLVAYAAVPELCPNKWRAVGIASIEGFLTIPWVALAFLIGNLLVLHATWRWVYYISIIYSSVCLAGTGILYFPPRGAAGEADKTRWQQFVELDFVGIFLYTGGLTSTLLGLSWGGNPGHAWGSASVVVPIVLGGVTFLASFVYDFVFLKESDRHALFPRHLLTRFREFTVSLIVIFASGMVYYTMSSFLPEATLFVYTNKPLEIGVMLLPNGLGQFVGTALVSSLISKTGHPKWYLIGGVFLQTLFTALYAYAIGKHKAAWMAFQFFGVGPFGLIVVTTVLNAGLHVRPSELGIAVGVLGTFRSMGGSVGNAIFGSILRSVANEQIPKRIITAALENGYTGDLYTLIPAVINAALGVPFAFSKVKGVTPAIETATMLSLQEAYGQAYRIVFYTTIPFGIVALISSLFVKDSTQYMTNHTHVHLTRDILRHKRTAQS